MTPTSIVAEYDSSIQVQNQILSLLIRDIDFCQANRAFVKPEYFSDEANTIIARIYFEKQDGSYEFDIHTLYDLIKRELSPSEKEYRSAIARRLKRLFTMQTQRKIVEEQVYAFYQKQEALKAVVETVTMLNKADYTKAVHHFNDCAKTFAVGKMSVADMGLDLFTTSPKKVLSRIQVKRIKTGYPSIDNLLHGGLGCGELGIIMAPSSRGKSIAVQDMAAAAATEPNMIVMVYTLEMPEPRYAERFYCRYLGYSKKELRYHIQEIKDQMRRMHTSTSSRLIIKEFPAKSVTVDQIHGHIRAMKAAGIPPDIVFVDYGDLLRPMDKRNDKREEIGDIFVHLRSVAQIEHIPIWTPTQSNRGSYNKAIVDLDDIAEDISKVMTCDTLLTMCQTREEKTNGQMRLFVAKNRNGTDKVAFQFMIDYDRMKLTDLGIQV